MLWLCSRPLPHSPDLAPGEGFATDLGGGGEAHQSVDKSTQKVYAVALTNRIPMQKHDGQTMPELLEQEIDTAADEIVKKVIQLANQHAFAICEKTRRVPDSVLGLSDDIWRRVGKKLS